MRRFVWSRNLKNEEAMVRVGPQRQNETKRNETKRNETKRNETKRNKTKRNKTKQNTRMYTYLGYKVAQLVETLCYKSEGRGFDSRLWHNASGRTMALGLTQPLTKMNTRNISLGGRGVKGCRCVGLTILPTSCADCLGNMGALTPWNPLGFSRPVMGLLYLYIWSVISCTRTLYTLVIRGLEYSRTTEPLQGYAQIGECNFVYPAGTIFFKIYDHKFAGKASRF